MPRPIYMTEEMIEESFKEVRESFEKQFEEAKAKATLQKLASGNFNFKFAQKQYYWDKDESRATIVLSPEAFSKTMLTVLSTDKEVGWHGLIHRDAEDKSKFILDDILLYPQAVTGATIDADSVEYPKWAMDLPLEQFNAMRFHGHSHVNMNTTPSSVDMNFREDLIAQFKDGFYVFMIINKRLETTAQIYDFDENNLYENDEIDIIVGEDDMAAEITKAAKEMVTTRTTTVGSYSYGSYGKNRSKGSSTKAPKPADSVNPYDYSFYDEEYWRGGSLK